MRTTISLDDRLAEQARRRAQELGLSVSAFIAKILKEALTRGTPPRATPFRLVTVDGTGPAPGIDLDRPRSIEVAEDAAHYAPAKAGEEAPAKVRRPSTARRRHT